MNVNLFKLTHNGESMLRTGLRAGFLPKGRKNYAGTGVRGC